MPRAIPRAALPLALAAALALGCKGGKGDKPSPEMASEGKELFGNRKTVVSGTADSEGVPLKNPARSEDWVILIEAFRGENRDRVAAETLRGVQGEGGLRDAYLEQRGETTILAYGRYPGPEDKRARADLERIQSMKFGDLTPYAAARLAPPMVEGSLPDLDLRNAKKTFGPDALYTLQVGVYSREDKERPSASEMAEFRRLAEEAAVRLRNQGETAFYYHGPVRSMVTVGIFGPDDFDPQRGIESEKIGQLRERHPFNLQNGRGILERRTETTPSGTQQRVERMQRSALVAVPDAR